MPSTLRWRHNGHDSVSNHQPPDCLLSRLFRRKSKKRSKLRVTGLCAMNSPGTGEFPAQMASNAENVSIWWRHHDSTKMQIWWLKNLVYFMLYIPDQHTTQQNGTVANEMFPTSKQLLTYSLKTCTIFNLQNTIACILQTMLRYKNYSRQDNYIAVKDRGTSSMNQSCGSFAFDFRHLDRNHPNINQVHKLQMIIYSSPIYNLYVQFLEMNFVYSTGCYEEGVIVISHLSKTILSQFCGEYDEFDMIYIVDILSINFYCNHHCLRSFLRIRYQPTHRLRNVPRDSIIDSDNYRILFERHWVANTFMFWVSAAFYNMICLVTYGKMENVTIFDGPSMNHKELKGMISSSFQILVLLSIYDTVVNIYYKTAAAPENVIFSDIHTTMGTRPIYRVYSAPEGFELNHVTIAGFRGEACNLGGLVLLTYDSYARWDAVGPYCGASFSNITLQNNVKSGVVIYSYGEVNISLCITSSTKKSEHFIIHMGPGNSPFITEVDVYHFRASIHKLTILPKPWSYGNNDISFMLINFTNVKYDHVKGYQNILLRRFITISTHAHAAKILRESGCDWWIETSGLDINTKGYLSEQLLLGEFDTLADNISIKWNQNCSVFPYPIIIDFIEMTNKTIYVYKQPRIPRSNFLFTHIDKRYTLKFPTFRVHQTYQIRVTAHYGLVQIWEVPENNCKFAKVTFGKDEGWMQSVTLDASKPQRFPSGYRNVSLLTVKNTYPVGGNVTYEACSLTLKATAYVRLSFRTDVKEVNPQRLTDVSTVKPLAHVALNPQT